MQRRHVRAAVIHRWPTPLRAGRFRRRYERFIAEIELEDGPLVRAHCVNPGRMEGLVIPGAKVWLSEVPGRALPWTWELIEHDGVLIGANTGLPNRLVGEVLRQGVLPGFESLGAIRPERPFGRGHRIDFELERDGRRHLLEVKNCHLVYPDGCGYFPDSVSERATTHVEALTRQLKQGVPATLLFTLQRPDVTSLRPSVLHDPAFATAVRRGVRAGLEVRAIRLVPSLEGITFAGEVPVVTDGVQDLEQLAAWSAAFDATSGWARSDGGWAGRSLPVKKAKRSQKTERAPRPRRAVTERT